MAQEGGYFAPLRNNFTRQFHTCPKSRTRNKFATKRNVYIRTYKHTNAYWRREQKEKKYPQKRRKIQKKSLKTKKQNSNTTCIYICVRCIESKYPNIYMECLRVCWVYGVVMEFGKFSISLCKEDELRNLNIIKNI